MSSVQQHSGSDETFELVPSTVVSHVPPKPDEPPPPMARSSSNVNESQEEAISYSWVDRWWLWETGSWLSSFLSLIAAVAMLISLNHKEIPDWSVEQTLLYGSYHFSLVVSVNAVLSILATLFKTNLLLCVATLLLQQKWLMLNGPSTTAKVYPFDEARQGPLGSAKLIWSLRGRHLASLGAALIICALAIEFSFQETVEYTKSFLPNSDEVALMPRISNFSLSGTMVPNSVENTPQTKSSAAGLDMMTAVWQGIWSANDTQEFVIDANCTAGTCIWDRSYASLAVCSQCYDRTDLLNVQCAPQNLTYLDPDGKITFNSSAHPYYTDSRCNVTLLGRVSINEYDEIPADLANGHFVKVQGYLPWEYPNGFPNPWAFTGFSHIQVSYTGRNTTGTTGDAYYITNRSFPATECALQLCVKAYSANASRDTTSEIVVGEPYQDSVANHVRRNSGQTVLTPPATFFPSNYSSEQPRSFVYDDPAFLTLRSPFLFTNTFSNDTDGTVIDSWHTVWSGGVSLNYDDIVGQSVVQSNVTAATRFLSLNFDGINQVMNNVADSITSLLRTDGANGSRPENQPFGGTPMDLTIVINAQWLWLIFPASLTLLTLVFLVGTILATRRRHAPRWTSVSGSKFKSEEDAGLELLHQFTTGSVFRRV